jgi:hypothetical protein
MAILMKSKLEEYLQRNENNATNESIPNREGPTDP